MQTMFISSEAILAQLPGYIVWKDINSKFTAANLKVTQELLGFDQIENIIGLTDADANCAAAECALEFQRQDAKVMTTEKEMTILDIHPYAINPKMILFKKKPFYNEFGDVEGVNAIGIEINEFILSKVYNKIISFEKRFIDRKKNIGGITKQLVDSFDFGNLTPRETEVLYYSVCGYSAQDIAIALKLSPRTIETHLANIKIKIGVNKKSELISFCLEHGFLSLIPRSILSKKENSLLNISIELIG